MDWLAFMEKKRNELANTGYIMDDETFITHLLNSLPQAEYEGAILVIKERLRGRSCNHSVCKECAIICTDAYSDEEYEEMVVYGDQGIT